MPEYETPTPYQVLCEVKSSDGYFYRFCIERATKLVCVVKMNGKAPEVVWSCSISE